ncbi:MAG: hypothetical protein EBR82_28510 [Caulobacteraceae bacterium]|nr:hypothetical protein [Caulobacteraceae bacterium]
MDLTRANLNRLREDWRVIALDAFTTGAAPVASRICQQETSNNAINVYNLLVALPMMRRFRDRVKGQNLAMAQHRIANDEHEATIEVPQADVERDQIGQYSNMFSMLGIAARRRPDRDLAQLLIDAFTVTDYTGTAFFANSKPHLPGVVDVGTFDNLMTEKPSAGSWEAAKTLMASIMDLNGEPMGLGQQKTVICSQKWESTFRRILNAELIMQVAGTNTAAAAVTNIYQGDAELIVLPYLNTSARQDKWFVLDTSWPLRAFINQTEVDMRFYAQDDPNTHKDAFDRHLFRYQVYARGEVGFGLPQLAVGSTGADAAL